MSDRTSQEFDDLLRVAKKQEDALRQSQARAGSRWRTPRVAGLAFPRPLNGHRWCLGGWQEHR